MTVLRIFPISIALHGLVMAAVLATKPCAIEHGQAATIELALVGETGIGHAGEAGIGGAGEESGGRGHGENRPRLVTARETAHGAATRPRAHRATAPRNSQDRLDAGSPNELEAAPSVERDGLAAQPADMDNPTPTVGLHAALTKSEVEYPGRQSEPPSSGETGDATEKPTGSGTGASSWNGANGSTGPLGRGGGEGGLPGGATAGPGLRKIAGERPRYPVLARRQGVEGWVAVRLTVRRDGMVEAAQVVGASPAGLFDRAAIEAIRTWRFAPLLAETVTADIDVKFTLADAASHAGAP